MTSSLRRRIEKLESRGLACDERQIMEQRMRWVDEFMNYAQQLLDEAGVVPRPDDSFMETLAQALGPIESRKLWGEFGQKMARVAERLGAPDVGPLGVHRSDEGVQLYRRT